MDSILIKVRRGPLAENLLRGHVAIVSQNKLIAYVGNPDYLTFMRSAAKPIQATIAIESGAADRFGLNDEELSVMCGSHIGDSYHCQAVSSILSKIGLTENDLHLYKDISLGEKLREQRIANHEEPRLIYNNCSGKHACMLAVCRHLGWDISTYFELEHPVQQMILRNIADFAGMAPEDILTGLDGCGVPVFAMPLRSMAKSYLFLVHPDLFSEERHAQSSRRITAAMEAHPEMLFGNGFFATELIRATKGRIIGKIGADGIFCLSAKDPQVAVALKMEDGNIPLISIAVMRVLSELDLLTRKERDELACFSQQEHYNCNGRLVGTSEAVFTLQH